MLEILVNQLIILRTEKQKDKNLTSTVAFLVNGTPEKPNRKWEASLSRSIPGIT